MASPSTNLPQTGPTLGAGPLRSLAAVIAALARSLRLAAIDEARLNRVQRLQTRSDAQLAEMDLRRDEIARHVFGDL